MEEEVKDTLLVDEPTEDTPAVDENTEPVDTEKVVKEEQSEGEAKDGEKADKGKTDGAPENYEDFALPENMEVDTELLEKAIPVFKELNLTQEQAQKLVDLQAQHLLEASQKQLEAWHATLEDWSKQSQNDKEFGGKAFDENVATAKNAIKEFGSDEFKEMLNFTGVGNHPEMIRFLYHVGKAVSEDKFLQGGPANTTRDPAKVMFPDMN